MPDPDSVPVELARALSGEVRIDRLDVPSGSTLQQAIEIALEQGLVTRAELAELVVGVHGLRKPPGYLLHPDDRIELTGPLTVDPRIARQRRVAKRRAALPRDKWSPDR